MSKNNTITESKASSMVDEANIYLRKKMQEVVTAHTLLKENVDGLDMDADVGEVAGSVKLRGNTVKAFLDIYNDPKFGSDAEVGAHFNTSWRTVRRAAMHIMENYPGYIKRLKSQETKKVHPGSGRGRSMDASGGAPRGRSVDNLTTVFSGEVYTDYTKIPPRRWDKWNIFQKKRSVRPIRSVGIRPIVFDKVFLFGFQMEDQPNIFYELWYNAYDSSYMIHDSYGYEASNSFTAMNTAVDAFVDLIGSFGDDQMGSRMEKNITNFADRAAKNNLSAAERESEKIEREWNRELHKESHNKLETQEDVDMLLEQQIETRGMLAQIVSTEMVKEYHVSRLRRHDAKKFWQAWGKNVEFPSKYMNRGGRGPFKIFSSDAEATFNVGLTFLDRVDVEIWFINRDDNNPPAYYVFDLTSGKIIGQRIRRFRDAYFLAARFLAAQTETGGR